MPSVIPKPTRHSRVARRARLFPSQKKILVVFAVTLLVLLGFCLVKAVAIWKGVSAMVAPLEAGSSDTVRIYDRRDKIVCTICGNEDRIPVQLTQVSTNMQHALIAAEDHSFYSHHGINPESVARAAFVDVKSGRVVEGGSTITQQLAKILYSKGEKRGFGQKIKEAMIAWQLESHYSKEKLLEAYLNQVYFGRGAYGVERAAELYFGKPAAKLNVAESAFLAGLINSPSFLSQQAHRTNALARQGVVLDAMVTCGFITAADASNAKLAPLHIRASSAADAYYLYYVDAVMNELHDRFPSLTLDKDGLSIFTNMDADAQRSAVLAINKGVARAPRGVSQAALVSISVKDGGVEALVGGAGDFWKHQFNRATNPHTVGSSFKPFVYLAALISGTINPQTVLNDEPITINQPGAQPYSPRNFDRQFMGPITVRKALAESRNVCAVKVGVDTGIDKVIKVAQLAGITAPMNPDAALALGSCAVSPIEMAGAYSTLARFGTAIHPQLLRRVEDFHGHILARTEVSTTQAFDKEPVAELVDMLQDVVQSGTGTGAQLPGRPVAGKTGTADQAKDLWFVGFTPDMVTATWGGNDDNQPISGSRATGGLVMASVWRNYMLSYYKLHPTAPGRFLEPATPMDRVLSQYVPATDLAPSPDGSSVHSDEAPGFAPPFSRNHVRDDHDSDHHDPDHDPGAAPEPEHHKRGVFGSVGHFFKNLFH